MNEQWLGLLRDFLKLLGGALVTNGIVTSANWTTYAGLIVMLAPMGWSLYERTHKRMVEKADALPEVSGVVTTNTTEGRQLAKEVPSKTVVPAGTTAANAVANEKAVS